MRFNFSAAALQIGEVNKLICGCKLVQALFCIGVSRKELLYFVMFSLKTPSEQKIPITGANLICLLPFKIEI
jgi:hypothetical protein